MPREPQDQPPAHGPQLVGDSGNVAAPTSLSQTWRSQIPHYAQDEMDLFQDTVDAIMPGAEIQVESRGYVVPNSIYKYPNSQLGYASDVEGYVVKAVRETPEGRRQIFMVDWADVGGRDMDWRAIYSDQTYSLYDIPRLPGDQSQWETSRGPISSIRTQVVGWNSIIQPENDTIRINENTVAGGYAGAILRKQAQEYEYTMIPGF